MRFLMSNRMFRLLLCVYLITNGIYPTAAASEIDQEETALPTVWFYGSTNNWRESHDTIYCKRLDILEYSRSGLTIVIDGKNYYPIVSAMMGVPTAQAKIISDEEESAWYVLGIRREGGRVFVNYKQYLDYLTRSNVAGRYNASYGDKYYIPYHLTEDGELVLYDYNMQVNDKYRSVDGHEDITVAEKDSVTLNDGKRHCRLTLSNGLVLIDGVGCVNSNGRLFDYLKPSVQVMNDYCYLLSVVDAYGNLLYENTDKKVMQSDIVDVDKIKPDVQNSSSIYTLQGCKQTGTPTKGIYIYEGKKLIVKQISK